MTETQIQTDKPFPFSFDSGEFAALGKKRFEAFVNAQTELLDEIQEANRHWMDRFQSEADLASEYASKLSATRTIPDAMGGVARLGGALSADAGGRRKTSGR